MESARCLGEPPPCPAARHDQCASARLVQWSAVLPFTRRDSWRQGNTIEAAITATGANVAIFTWAASLDDVDASTTTGLVECRHPILHPLHVASAAACAAPAASRPRMSDAWLLRIVGSRARPIGASGCGAVELALIVAPSNHVMVIDLRTVRRVISHSIFIWKVIDDRRVGAFGSGVKQIGFR